MQSSILFNVVLLMFYVVIIGWNLLRRGTRIVGCFSIPFPRSILFIELLLSVRRFSKYSVKIKCEPHKNYNTLDTVVANYDVKKITRLS